MSSPCQLHSSIISIGCHRASLALGTWAGCASQKRGAGESAACKQVWAGPNKAWGFGLQGGFVDESSPYAGLHPGDRDGSVNLGRSLSARQLASTSKRHPLPRLLPAGRLFLQSRTTRWADAAAAVAQRRDLPAAADAFPCRQCSLGRRSSSRPSTDTPKGVLHRDMAVQHLLVRDDKSSWAILVSHARPFLRAQHAAHHTS